MLVICVAAKGIAGERVSEGNGLRHQEDGFVMAQVSARCHVIPLRRVTVESA